jgi:predicted alpha/beta hydrolase family esterase
MVPGVNNSGPGHWQTIWQEKHPEYRRAAQWDWDFPYCDEWVEGLQQAIDDIQGEIVLVAHSLGCLTVAHWARTHRREIRGALLVAPVDPENFGGDFAPLPLEPLPFPSILVASTTDEYVTPERARLFAEAWGSRFVNVGPGGHINAASGFGPWPEGEELLRELLPPPPAR